MGNFGGRRRRAGSEGGGIARGATARPGFRGFRGFRGFCLPLAGGFKGLWYRRFAAMKFYMPLRGKTKQPRLRRVEMHPFCRLRLPTNPVTCFPLGERWCVSTKRGAFPSGEARL